MRVKETRDVPLVLCGSKCDLESERVVSATEGEVLSQRLGGAYETSRKRSILSSRYREGQGAQEQALPTSMKAKNHKEKRCTLL